MRVKDEAGQWVGVEVVEKCVRERDEVVGVKECVDRGQWVAFAVGSEPGFDRRFDIGEVPLGFVTEGSQRLADSVQGEERAAAVVERGNFHRDAELQDAAGRRAGD